MKSSGSVSGVILAAGTSQRMGHEVKQLLKLRGKTLLCRVIHSALASQLNEVVVVLGHAAQQVAASLDDLDVRTIENPDFAEGQSTSVRAGLRAIEPTARAALFMQGDQPLLSSALIDRILEAHQKTNSPIVQPVHTGQRGAPVLFGRALFPELEALRGDTGGRSVISRYRSKVADVEVDDPLELADVDTVDDLQKLEAALAQRQGAVL